MFEERERSKCIFGSRRFERRSRCVLRGLKWFQERSRSSMSQGCCRAVLVVSRCFKGFPGRSKDIPGDPKGIQGSSRSVSGVSMGFLGIYF